MKFALDCRFEVGDEPLNTSALLGSLDRVRDLVKNIGSLEGELLLTFNGKPTSLEFTDPLLRLVGGWLKKLPWVVGGDTETVALRNSNHCFAFVPAGNGVEISFYEGDETEIENYVLDPVKIRLDDFAEELIRLGRQLLSLVEAIDAGLLDSDEDCREFSATLEEATKVWHDHQLHTRR